MIDLHSHILPGMDDGARDLEACLAMARRYAAHGYRQVVTTPHALTDSLQDDLARSVKLQVANVNAVLRDHSLDLTLQPGMEIAMTPEVPDLLDQGRLLTLAGSRFVLLEPPFERLPIHWEHMFFDITSRGYRILLAHPERCAQLGRDPSIFDRLIATGAYLQANWGSFLGLFGKESKRAVHYLARRGYLHCLATDSHDAQQRSPDVVRPAARKVAALVGRTNLSLLAIENPARVITDDPLKEMTVDEAARPAAAGRKRWMFWKG
jgi:protein-tyrosine phosphatase